MLHAAGWGEGPWALVTPVEAIGCEWGFKKLVVSQENGKAQHKILSKILCSSTWLDLSDSTFIFLAWALSDSSWAQTAFTMEL